MRAHGGRGPHGGGGGERARRRLSPETPLGPLTARQCRQSGRGRRRPARATGVHLPSPRRWKGRPPQPPEKAPAMGGIGTVPTPSQPWRSLRCHPLPAVTLVGGSPPQRAGKRVVEALSATPCAPHSFFLRRWAPPPRSGPVELPQVHIHPLPMGGAVAPTPTHRGWGRLGWPAHRSRPAGCKGGSHLAGLAPIGKRRKRLYPRRGGGRLFLGPTGRRGTSVWRGCALPSRAVRGPNATVSVIAFAGDRSARRAQAVPRGGAGRPHAQRAGHDRGLGAWINKDDGSTDLHRRAPPTRPPRAKDVFGAPSAGEKKHHEDKRCTPALTACQRIFLHLIRDTRAAHRS